MVITCLALGLFKASADEQARYKLMISCGHSSGTLQHGHMNSLHLRSMSQTLLRLYQQCAWMNVQWCCRAQMQCCQRGGQPQSSTK